LEKDAESHGFASRILKKLEGLPLEKEVINEEERKYDPLNMDKASLRLMSFPGEFLKPCPGTKAYICCGYMILHIGTNCPLDCTYCILQAYFNQPSLRIFVNLEEKLHLIAGVIDSRPDELFRIGTGEFTDSLALDPVTALSDVLMPFVSKRQNAVLELKTKTDNIERLLSSKIRNRIIVSWSLNSPRITSREEHGAPGIRKRLQAAKKCQEEGFVVGFHFDPLIEHPGWKEEYAKTIDMMDRYIDPKGIIWMSLGCLRYMPSLKPIIRRRHPGSAILDGEFVPGLDGKMRYFKPIRTEMYRFVSGRLDQWYGDLGLYLCMESDEIWKKSLGWSPGNSEGLSHYLDKRVIKHFDLQEQLRNKC
jgi:spore photoproduct lyase